MEPCLLTRGEVNGEVNGVANGDVNGDVLREDLGTGEPGPIMIPGGTLNTWGLVGAPGADLLADMPLGLLVRTCCT